MDQHQAVTVRGYRATRAKGPDSEVRAGNQQDRGEPLRCLRHNYAVQVLAVPPDLGGGYEALFPVLARSVVGYGQTRQDAIDDLLEAARAFIEAVNETGQQLPATEAPRAWDEFSGKFNVRVPKLLHANLARLSDEQGVSLNSIVQTILMSGATSLEAGHEFGAIVEIVPEQLRGAARTARGTLVPR